MGPLVCGARALEGVGNPRTAAGAGETLRSCLLCDPSLVAHPLWVPESRVMGDAFQLWVSIDLSGLGNLDIPLLRPL